MMVGFLRSDLTCAIRAYLNAMSSIERSLHLRKIYLTEVSALTHLYGYNEKKKTQSLWSQLMSINEDCNERELASLTEKLEELTFELDRTRRNLHNHFREDEELNILKRYEAYNNLNQIDEIKRAHKLLSLCKDIEDYTMSELSRIQKNQQQESQKQNDRIHVMFERMRNIPMGSETKGAMKIQWIAMIDEMERKFVGFGKTE